jgi:hypothetical protein
MIMAVHCAHCGEELLGAVNRCWRCGTMIESHGGQQDLPPVRQTPVPPIEAGEGEAASPAASRGESAPADVRLAEDHGVAAEVYEAALADDVLAEPSDDTPRQPRRRGSPFAASYAPASAPPAVTEEPASKRTSPTPAYPKNPAAAGGAVAALVLGLLSVACSFFTIGALFFALAGLPVGIWGLYSNRRGQAIAGVLLCCIALAISGFHAAALIYEVRYGFTPWETPGTY